MQKLNELNPNIPTMSQLQFCSILNYSILRLYFAFLKDYNKMNAETKWTKTKRCNANYVWTLFYVSILLY